MLNSENETQLGRIIFIFNGRFPGEQAHSLFVAKSVEALHSLGFKTIVLAPDRTRPTKSPREYFSLNFDPTVFYLKTIDFARFKFFQKLAYYVGNTIFDIRVKTFLKENVNKNDIVYTNDIYVLPFLRKYNVCFELHDFPERYLWLYGFYFRFAKKILVTNKWKEIELHRIFPETKGKTFIELNAVDLKKFEITQKKDELRKYLNLRSDKKIVLYTGHLYSWKGAETLAQTAGMLPQVQFYFLGGKKPDIISFKEKYSKFKNIYILGHQPHEYIPMWQKAADVLIIPNTAKIKISKYYTSPMKLFEYMASKVPIVASDIPSIREVADERMVYFAKPDTPDSFAEQITLVLNSGSNDSKTIAAYAAVSNHTWSARAERIIVHLRQLL